jgi:hypothetical protein
MPTGKGARTALHPGALQPLNSLSHGRLLWSDRLELVVQAAIS